LGANQRPALVMAPGSPPETPRLGIPPALPAAPDRHKGALPTPFIRPLDGPGGPDSHRQMLGSTGAESPAAGLPGIERGGPSRLCPRKHVRRREKGPTAGYLAQRATRGGRNRRLRTIYATTFAAATRASTTTRNFVTPSTRSLAFEIEPRTPSRFAFACLSPGTNACIASVSRAS